MQLNAVRRVRSSMELNGNRQKETEAGLYERLLMDKDARIAELTAALEHEREQSRCHASAHERTQTLLKLAGPVVPDTHSGNVPSTVNPSVMFSGWGTPALLWFIGGACSIAKTPFHSITNLASTVTFWQIVLGGFCVLITFSLQLKASKQGNTEKIRLISNACYVALALINMSAIIVDALRVPQLHRDDWYAVIGVIVVSIAMLLLNVFWIVRRRRTAFGTSAKMPGSSASV